MSRSNLDNSFPAIIVLIQSVTEDSVVYQKLFLEVVTMGMVKKFNLKICYFG